MIQVALTACFFLLVCGALSWWLYRRETVLARQRMQAEARARQLLGQLLTADEHYQLSARGYIEIASRLVAGRTYHVPERRGQVQVYEEGRHAGSLCIEPTRWVPDSDVILMHKLMLEGNEAEYLRTANLFRPCRMP